MKDLIALYKSLLHTAWMKSDVNGFVNHRTKTAAGDDAPATVGGKRLVLPIDHQLRHPDTETRILFHPLSESALKGESAVVSKLRHGLSVRLNYSVGSILRDLIKLGADTARHQHLSPEQSEILSVIKNVDEKSVVDFSRILINATKQLGAESAFITLYLKRGGTVSGKVYARAGIVTFPVYDELKKEQDEYFGVELRKKDLPMFLALFRHVFPGIDEHYYNRGSNSDVAPYIDALMKTVAGLGGVVNNIVSTYQKFIEDDELLVIESDWEESFDNLIHYLPEIRSIPTQFSGDGAPRREDEMKQQVAITVQNGTGPAAYIGGPPDQRAVAPTSIQKPALTMAEIMAQRQQTQQAAQPQYQQAYIPAQMSAPPLVSEKGLNVRELMRQRQQGGNQFPQQQQNQGYSMMGHAPAQGDPYANGV